MMRAALLAILLFPAVLVAQQGELGTWKRMDLAGGVVAHLYVGNVWGPGWESTGPDTANRLPGYPDIEVGLGVRCADPPALEAVIINGPPVVVAEALASIDEEPTWRLHWDVEWQNFERSSTAGLDVMKAAMRIALGADSTDPLYVYAHTTVGYVFLSLPYDHPDAMLARCEG